MFTHDRQTILDGLANLGGGICGYSAGAEAWAAPDSRCDCKYGAKHPASMARESNGCPELRSAYGVIAALTDEEWEVLSERMGGVITASLFSEDARRARVLAEAERLEIQAAHLREGLA